jgi:hypothetical protein
MNSSTQRLEQETHLRCTCVNHPIYGVEVNHWCPLHGDFCEHGKACDEYCQRCDIQENPWDFTR